MVGRERDGGRRLPKRAEVKDVRREDEKESSQEGRKVNWNTLYKNETKKGKERRRGREEGEEETNSRKERKRKVWNGKRNSHTRNYKTTYTTSTT